jgi:HK97 gp10 family phage protein
MDDGISVEIEGLEDALKQLDELPLVVVKRTFREALDAACVPVLEALLAEPIPFLTGDLRAHVMFAIKIDPDGHGGTAYIGFGDAGWKARLVEYGHRMVGHKPDLKELGFVRSHPFMRPAAEVSWEAAVEAFGARLIEMVNADIIVIDERTAA